MNNNYLIEMKNITKRFPGVVALDNIDFIAKKRRTHGLIGENGAGKSTLVKIISGVYKQDGGSFYFDGKKILRNDPNIAEIMGISVVPQAVDYFSHLNVAENIFIDSIPTKAGFIDTKHLFDKTVKWMKIFNLDLEPSSPMASLSFVNKKIVLILKAISKNSKMIILDEPTASLHKEETEILFKYIKNCKSMGVTFIYISHYLDEIFQVCDDVTILKDGKVVSSGEVKQFNMRSLVESMLGKIIEKKGYFSEINHNLGETVFEVKNISDKKNIVKDVTFNLRKGELLSIAGIRGSGKEEIVDMLFGFLPKKNGNIFINGKEIKEITVRNIFNNGMYFVPEDRQGKGLILEFSVAKNISIASLFKIRNKFGFLSPKREKKLVEKYKGIFSIITPTINKLVKFLSGGNQQKVVFSKVMATEPQILLLHGPTVGIDVGTKSEIHKIIENLARSGISIILVTEEIDEILNMSDRVIIIFDGKIIKEIKRGEKDFNRKDIILYMESGIDA